MPAGEARTRWRTEFETGVSEIDKEHRLLIERLQSMELAIVSRCSSEVICQFLAEFSDYLIRHFEAEEKTMVRRGAPLFEAHCEEHAALLHELQHLERQFEHTGKLPFRAVQTFLWDWTVEHISRDVQCLAEPADSDPDKASLCR